MLRYFVFAIIFAVVAPAAGVADTTLDADAAWAKAQAGELLIVDVRSKQEWQATGIPKNAKPVTIHDAQGLEGFYRKLLAAVDGDKGRRIAVICASGVRSNRARRFLESKGFANIVDISEGMLGNGNAPGWLKRELPTEPWSG